MEEKRGVLYLEASPGTHDTLRDARMESASLVFGEGEGWLSQAQTALWELRKRCAWICVAAGRGGAGAAAALAAQLPVDRLALAGSQLFDRSGPRLQGQAARLERFARRNLALVISEVMLIGATDREIQGFISLFGRRRVCALEACGENFLTASWAQVNENNLLIPGKCVYYTRNSILTPDD